METRVFKLKFDKKTVEAIQAIVVTTQCFIVLNALSNLANEIEYIITAKNVDWAWINHILEEKECKIDE